MRRSKNLMAFRSLFSSSPMLSSSSSQASYGSSPSFFRVSGGTTNGGLYSNGGVPNPTIAAMGLDQWASSTLSHHPTISCSARFLLVGLLTAFALVNLYVAGQGRRDDSVSGLGMFGAGAAASMFGFPSTHHVRGVTLRESWITSASQPFNMNGLAQAAKHLIVVAGHSVTVSGHLEDAGLDEHDWYLLEYQKHKGLPQAILGHIKAGIRAAASDPSALLVMSGGQTRAMTGPDSEGASYYRVADAMNLWAAEAEAAAADASSSSQKGSQPSPQKSDSTVRARTVSEDFATDSFENLMFSICRFHEVTGAYPESITVVSFTFKQRRFETMHASALQWPSHRLHYVGVDPPASSGFNLDEAANGEAMNAAAPFEADPYGCHSDVLQAKRKDRNPFFRTPPYVASCPDMAQVLSFCGPELISKDQVPWKHLWS